MRAIVLMLVSVDVERATTITVVVIRAVFVKLHFDNLSDIIEVLVFLLGYHCNFLILSLPVVREPASDLFLSETSLIGQLNLVILFEVRMLNIVKEPFLKNFCLVLLECGACVFIPFSINLMRLLSFRL